MNKIIFILSFFLVVLLYKFTFSDGSYRKYSQLKNHVSNLEIENTRSLEKINILRAEIKNLKTDLPHVIEEKARKELGLIKENETFYQILK
tara:strand:+ start:457 stop:729 length:273 start_codon:yes stop_codon:yes gene_type:complete